MKELKLVQGSPEWLEVRLTHCCASEAPMMMGDSKHVSRNELLRHKKGWSTTVTDFQQSIFDKGHKSEELARGILEDDEATFFAPVVYSETVIGMDLLASLDGINEWGTEIFEHKLWNDILAENVNNNILPSSHYWQLEHQLLVTGAHHVIFVVSDGTEAKRAVMKYRSIPARRTKLITGWKQFLKDLAVFEIEAKAEVVEAEAATLPAITFLVTGTEIVTNISTCLTQVKALAEVEMNRTLETDFDFANKDLLNKDVKKARAKLKLAVESVRGEFVSYSEFEDIAKQLDSVLQKMQSDGERKVKAAKIEVKANIYNIAIKKLNGLHDKAELFIWEDNFNIGRTLLNGITSDFEGVMKNKRNIESLQNAVDTELARVEILINERVEMVEPNVKYFKEHIGKYEHLFNFPAICSTTHEAFVAIFNSRISKQKDAEETERLRVKKETEDAALKKERADVEVKRIKDEADELERVRIADEAKALEEKQAEVIKPITLKSPLTPVNSAFVEEARNASQEAHKSDITQSNKKHYFCKLTQAEINEIWINCLNKFGLDNWDGYDDALERFNFIVNDENISIPN
jgi:predicted phage-related endonuclease